MQISGNNRGWLAETGSQVTAHTTIQSSRTAETVVDRKEAVSARISPVSSPDFPSLCTLRCPEPIFGLRSLHPKIPFLAAGFRGGKRPFGGLEIGDSAKQNGRSSRGHNYCGFSPSASNCRYHSSGASRRR